MNLPRAEFVLSSHFEADQTLFLDFAISLDRLGISGAGFRVNGIGSKLLLIQERTSLNADL